MKGSAITGPVGKEAAELWPVSTMLVLTSNFCGTNISSTAYRLQLWCCDVSGCLLRETVHSGGVRAAFYAQASSMISCHEGTSSQTIFSAETELLTLCKDNKCDIRCERDAGLLAACDILVPWVSYADTRLGNGSRCEGT
jgi:hypothetical protein